MKKYMGNYSKAHLIKNIFIAVAIGCCFIACTKNNEPARPVSCDSGVKSFAADVQPLIQTSCSFDSDCHGSGSTSGPGQLLTYVQISGAGSAIHAAVSSGSMPKDDHLSTTEKNTILCWLDSGAQNN